MFVMALPLLVSFSRHWMYRNSFSGHFLNSSCIVLTRSREWVPIKALFSVRPCTALCPLRTHSAPFAHPVRKRSMPAAPPRLAASPCPSQAAGVRALTAFCPLHTHHLLFPGSGREAAYCLVPFLHPFCTRYTALQEEEPPGHSPQAGSLPMSIPGGGREGRTYRVCNNENGSGSVTVRLRLCQWVC